MSGPSLRTEHAREPGRAPVLPRPSPLAVSGRPAIGSHSALRVRVREAADADHARLRQAFNDAHRRLDPQFQPRSLEAWSWRYRDNPAGQRCLFAEDAAGRIVGQVGGLAARARIDGQDVRWTQVCDTYVDPPAVGSLGGGRLFKRLVQPFAERYAGPSPQGDPVLYGLPTRRAHRIGGREAGYRVIRNQHQLVLDATRGSRGASRDRANDVAVEPLARDDGSFEGAARDLDALFERATAGTGATLVKDAEYLRWRYLRRPDVDYCLVLARDAGDGRPLGLAVGTRGRFGGVDGGLIAEWLVDPGEAQRTSAALLQRLQSFARARGIGRLVAVQAERDPHFGWFQQAGFRVTPSPYYLVGRGAQPGVDARWLYEHWCYQLGDFDLC